MVNTSLYIYCKINLKKYLSIQLKSVFNNKNNIEIINISVFSKRMKHHRRPLAETALCYPAGVWQDLAYSIDS